MHDIRCEACGCCPGTNFEFHAGLLANAYVRRFNRDHDAITRRGRLLHLIKTWVTDHYLDISDNGFPDYLMTCLDTELGYDDPEECLKRETSKLCINYYGSSHLQNYIRVTVNGFLRKGNKIKNLRVIELRGEDNASTDGA